MGSPLRWGAKVGSMLILLPITQGALVRSFQPSLQPRDMRMMMMPTMGGLKITITLITNLRSIDFVPQVSNQTWGTPLHDCLGALSTWRPITQGKYKILFPALSSIFRRSSMPNKGKDKSSTENISHRDREYHHYEPILRDENENGVPDYRDPELRDQQPFWGDSINNRLKERRGEIFKRNKWRFWYVLILSLEVLTGLCTFLLFPGSFGYLIIPLIAVIGWTALAGMHYTDSEDRTLNMWVSALDSIVLVFTIFHFVYVAWVYSHSQILKNGETDFESRRVSYNKDALRSQELSVEQSRNELNTARANNNYDLGMA